MTRSSLRDNLDCAEEEVEISPDIWCIVALSEGELGTPVWRVCDGFVVRKRPVGWEGGLLSEVDGIVGRCKTGCCWASGCRKSSIMFS